MKELNELAEVIPGAAKSVYELEATEELDKVYLLKGTNIDSEGNISTELMDAAYLSPGKNDNRYMLTAGDIVVMARGSAMRVALVDDLVEQKRVIASANFLIIRPNAKKLQSEVVVAYLNSSIGQAALSSLNVGAATRHIPTSKLRGLAIPVPAHSSQNQIVDIFHASKEAYKATRNFAEQQKVTASASMLSLMMESAQ